MKLYSGRVRLAGEIKNEVNKENLTASEILILRAIHGASENASDPVVAIEETGSVNRSDSRERARLESIYTSFRGQDGPKLVRSILGPPGVPLPQEYVEPEAPAEVDEIIDPLDNEPEVIVAKEPEVKRTKVSFKQKVEADAKEAEAA